MFFLSRLDIDRRISQMRRELEERGIQEELRGWSWNNPPVSPPLREMTLSVSELASRYCPTMRDIYLRRVRFIRPPPSIKMARGIAFHKISHDSLIDVKRIIYSSENLSGSLVVEKLLPRAGEEAEAALREAESRTMKLNQQEGQILLKECEDLYKFLVIQAASQIDQAMSKFPHAGPDSIASIAIPPVAERKVDGTLVGLSSELSVDLYAPASMVIDLKTGEVRKFHPYIAAGYALAIEAQESVPVNFGLIIYLKFEGRSVPSIRTKYFLISDEIRREFLEMRDEAFQLILSGKDPGKPGFCPDYCPYYGVC
ncbi:MAG: type I-A CRISPR-associated protein Cas4/Csa1 [Candidatus Methanodesulfokora sp.]